MNNNVSRSTESQQDVYDIIYTYVSHSCAQYTQIKGKLSEYLGITEILKPHNTKSAQWRPIILSGILAYYDQPRVRQAILALVKQTSTPEEKVRIQMNWDMTQSMRNWYAPYPIQISSEKVDVASLSFEEWTTRVILQCILAEQVLSGNTLEDSMHTLLQLPRKIIDETTGEETEPPVEEAPVASGSPERTKEPQRPKIVRRVIVRLPSPEAEPVSPANVASESAKTPTTPPTAPTVKRIVRKVIRKLPSTEPFPSATASQ